MESISSPWNSPGQNTGVGNSFPSPGDLPNPGIELRSPALQADSLPADPWEVIQKSRSRPTCICAKNVAYSIDCISNQ